MKVFIYRNLNRKGHVYSIKTMEGPLKGRVIGYANGLLIQNCEFHVSESGRQRVLRDKRKYVHAGIVGDLIAVTGYQTRIHNAGTTFEYYSEETWRKRYSAGLPITYNPYVSGHFTIKGTKTALRAAEHVCILNEHVHAHFKHIGNKNPLFK